VTGSSSARERNTSRRSPSGGAISATRVRGTDPHGAQRRTTIADAGRAAAASIARAWRRFRAGAARTVSPAGWLVLVSAAAGLALGGLFGWVEAIVAGLGALVLLALSAPFLVGARGYDVELRLDHQRIVAGQDATGVLRIRNSGHRTLLPGRIEVPVRYVRGQRGIRERVGLRGQAGDAAVHGAVPSRANDDFAVDDGLLDLRVPLLRAAHVLAEPITIPAPRRGVIVVGPPTAVRTDPVSLLRRAHEWDDRHDLYVHPRTVAVPATSAGLVRDLEGSASRRLVDSDMSFHAIRAYLPGDARRQIHWKSTAKTGQLMVRQFEETVRARLGVVLSLAAGDYATGEEFELAVSAAASLAVQAMREGRDLQVATGRAFAPSPGPRSAGPRSAGAQSAGARSSGTHAVDPRPLDVLRAPTRRDLLDDFSRLERAERTPPLEDVCRLVAEAPDPLSLAFVVCGSAVPVARLRRAALAFPPGTAVMAVVCDERAHPRLRPAAGGGGGDLTVLTIGLLGDLAALLARGAQS
jgi:uncharacterized protein (DUF58 family)